MLRMKTPLAIAAVVLMLAPLAAAQTVEINYQNLNLGFHRPSAPNHLIVMQRNNSIASGFLKDGHGNIVDTADIFNITAGQWFDLLFNAAVTNGPGTNDLSLNASFQATDNVTSMADPSINSVFQNANLLGDLDGISYGNGILRIEGIIHAAPGKDSILASPTSDWVYYGGAAGTDPGADGVADQMTIDAAARTNYQTGVLAVLEVSLQQFVDGTSTAGLDADGLFAQALLHQGFVSSSAQLQLTVIPEPAAALLGVLGLVGVSLARRRLA